MPSRRVQRPPTFCICLEEVTSRYLTHVPSLDHVNGLILGPHNEINSWAFSSRISGRGLRHGATHVSACLIVHWVLSHPREKVLIDMVHLQQNLQVPPQSGDASLWSNVIGVISSRHHGSQRLQVAREGWVVGGLTAFLTGQFSSIDNYWPCLYPLTTPLFLVPDFMPPNKLITADYFRHKNVCDDALTLRCAGHPQHLKKKNFALLSYARGIIIGTSHICFGE